MSETTGNRPAELIEGFGAAAFGAHIFRVDIPVAAKDDVTIIEDYGLKGGENGVPPRETRVVLARRFWSAIAETARKDFAARLKAKRLASPRWTAGDNKVDRMLGKELCVFWLGQPSTLTALMNARSWQPAGQHLSQKSAGGFSLRPLLRQVWLRILMLAGA
jgi:hypothetical protein